MDEPLYVVFEENTLGYIDSRQPERLCVVAARIGLNGSLGHDWRNGSIPVPRNKAGLREATRIDFEMFRVTPPPDLESKWLVQANPEWGRF